MDSCPVAHRGGVLRSRPSCGFGVSELRDVYNVPFVGHYGVELILRVFSSSSVVVRGVKNIERSLLHAVLDRVLELVPRSSERGVSVPRGFNRDTSVSLLLLFLVGIGDDGFKVLLDLVLGPDLILVNILVRDEEALSLGVLRELSLQIFHVDLLNLFVMEPRYFDDLLELPYLLPHLVIRDI